MPIEECGADWVLRVQWVYWDPPAWITRMKVGAIGVQWFYLLWQVMVHRAVRDRLDVEEFDVVHHLTFGKYWVPSSLWKLKRPFVFGPVGGGEYSPPSLAADLPLRARTIDWLKESIQRLLKTLPFGRGMCRNLSWAFAATKMTEQKLRRQGVEKVSVLRQSGISKEELAELGDCDSSKSPNTFHMITASRLIHWKAIDLAIKAVALLVDEFDVKLEILQEGPERGRLENLAESLGVSDRVLFLGKLPSREDVFRRIAASDCLVHPALHEAFGQSCLESMALGTPVVCLDWGGPGLIVDELTGIAVPPKGLEDTVQGLAASLRLLHQEKVRGETRAEACRDRARCVFSWSELVDELCSKYEEVADS
ncbi:glycosyltransferase family 4 protein [Akkermansiaceae bacterium]|nr:glycosyltransferase family 4 protein [Akkermansiaceae bacterium]MDB4596930.1 glycosyltransferase family 4 protein [Akkermansiaceae bacterium]